MSLSLTKAFRTAGSTPAKGPGVLAGAPRLVRLAIPPFVTLAVILGIWLTITYVILAPERRFLMPPPHEIAKVGFLDPANRAQMLSALLLSTQVAMVGLVIATVIGVSVAVVMSQARAIERALYPYAVVLQTIPILALVPLIGFWFEFGFTSRVIVCVLIALFPLIANTLFGLQSVDAAHHDLFTLHGASRWERLVKLQFPAALPALFTGLRIAAGLSVIGAVVGDMFFMQGQPGIGTLLDLYRSRLQSEQLFAAIFLSSLLGIVVFSAFGLLGRLVVGSWSTFGGGSGRER
ncbi:ABC transporter permease [Actinopolymorpha alba]|uniref:ABC transporter permease n=1 Tax=Actinopolymorpha alba TaxID=533267 RepID=UPI000382E6EB|nr:ABC transporter permease [Actinopolymorpha alba]